MDVTSIRLYGKKDLRREKWSLPDIKEDEILAKVMVDSVCMSTYKAVLQGETHRRVNDDIKTRPVIIGHETSCVLEKVGAKWQNHYCEGMTVALQPDLQLKDSMATIGYSFEYCGGLSTYVVLPNVVMEAGALLPFDPEQGYYAGALVEPISAVLASYKSMYHVDKGSKIHQMDIKKGGRMALLGSGGPMGFAAVSAALHRESKPSLLVASDLMEERLEKIRKIFGGKYQGIPIYYVQASGNKEEDIKALLEQSPDGFDDVGVFAPVTDLVEIADRVLGEDGCLNFFAGPVDPNFKAQVNFYKVHYKSTHYIGTSGSTTQDMVEALRLIEQTDFNPAHMVTHVGGLDSAIDATMDVVEAKGGKKLIYPNVTLPMTAVEDFSKRAEKDSRFQRMAQLIENSGGLWSREAEKELLKEFGE